MQYTINQDYRIKQKIAYVRTYLNSDNQMPANNTTSNDGLDGFTSFSGTASITASGVVNETVYVYYMPFRDLLPEVEVQKEKLAELLESAPEVRNK